jgi:uncharacterized membrane protein
LNKPKHASVHDRGQFQVDRIAFFSDAIIAIASTLLILEFKIPPLGRNHSWSEIRIQYSGRLIIPILGLILSFYSISRLWIKHHTLFEKLTRYNKRLLITNQVFLFLIMILPVTTSFMLEDDNPFFLRLFVYLTNLGLCNIVYYILLVNALRPGEGLSEITSAQYKLIKSRESSLFHGLSFLTAGILSIYTIRYFYFAFIPSGLFRFYGYFVTLKNYLVSRLK